MNDDLEQYENFDPFDWSAVDHFLGKIYDSGSSALYPTSPRYEVKRVQPKWSLARKDLLTVEDDKREAERARTVIATNLDEPATTHLLPVDKIVHVFGVVFPKATPVIHYFFHGGPTEPFLVKVEQTGGADATTATGTATYTYTARTMDGALILGTGLTPKHPRPKGKITAQSGSSGYGIGAIVSGAFELITAFEVKTFGACE